MDRELLEFITETTGTLARIEANQVRTTKDVNDLCLKCEKIPGIENGLNNHLKTHDTLMKYFVFPVSGSIILGALGLFFKLILHVF